MKRFFLILVVMVLLLPITTVQAIEPIPSKDFISITEKVLDALDELEVVFSNTTPLKIEVDMAYKKFDLAMLKYRRYVEDWRKTPGKQADIIKAIATANIQYKMTIMEGTYGKAHEDARLAVQQAREMFQKYKTLKK